MAYAAGTSEVKLVAPRSVPVGEKFAVTVSVSSDGDISEPSKFSIQGCNYVIGPSTSTSKSVSVVNGKVSKSSRVDFTFIFRADTKGEYTIPAINVKVNGVTRSTSPSKITITEGGRAQGGGSSAQASQGESAADRVIRESASRPVNPSDVFVRIILSKPTAYEQEAIECTIKLYTKFGISEFFPTRQPSFDGFLIEEMELQPSLNQVEEYNGQRYLTAVLKKCIIFPQKSGKLTINSGEYDIRVVQFDNINMGIFSIQHPEPSEVLKVTSNSASIDIKDLPEPAPAGFNGAVGTFDVSARLVGNTFRTGEAASLIYTINGTGNVKYVKEPDLTLPEALELYSPKSSFEGGVKGNNVTGTTTIDYTFVPQSVGEFTIETAPFVYFDPTTAEYKTIPLPVFKINVEQGSEQSASPVMSKLTDILDIVPDAKPGKETLLTVNSWFYWTLYAVLFVVLLVVIYLYGRNMRLNADVVGRRKSRADKVARTRLKAARAFLTSGNKERFYGELLSAVWGYLSDKMAIPASRLTRDNVTDEMRAFGAPQELIDRFITLLDDCETARYTPSSATSDTRLYDEAAAAINEMERVKQPSK